MPGACQPFVTGLARVAVRRSDGEGAARSSFEQYRAAHGLGSSRRGLANRSGAGDLDIVVYSARKWCAAGAGREPDRAAGAVRARRGGRVPQRGWRRAGRQLRLASSPGWRRRGYLGYLQRSEGRDGPGRPVRIPTGPSWWPSTGMTPSTPCTPCGSGCRASSCSPPGASPCPSPRRTAVTCARSAAASGRSPRSWNAVSETEARLAELRDSASLPGQPDRRWVDDWLHRSYLDLWASLRWAE